MGLNQILTLVNCQALQHNGGQKRGHCHACFRQCDPHPLARRHPRSSSPWCDGRCQLTPHRACTRTLAARQQKVPDPHQRGNRRPHSPQQAPPSPNLSTAVPQLRPARSGAGVEESEPFSYMCALSQSRFPQHQHAAQGGTRGPP